MRKNEWNKRPGRSSKFIWPATRWAIYARDDWRCAYCGKVCRRNDRTLDHIVPRHLGGHSRPDNLVLACRRCNFSKQASWTGKYIHATITAEHRAAGKAAMLRHYAKLGTKSVRS